MAIRTMHWKFQLHLSTKPATENHLFSSNLNVSGCIGTYRAWFLARKPIPDTFRYILIHSDTSRYMISKLRVPKQLKQHFGLIFHHNCQPPIVFSLNRHLSTVKSSLQHCRSFFGCSTFVSVLAGIEQTWPMLHLNSFFVFLDVHRSLWMKIVPYVYVNVQFHACWWNECEYNGDCYQPQDSPLTERPESRCKELRSLPTTKKKRSQSTKFENWCENVFKNCLRNPQKITKSIENDMTNS